MKKSSLKILVINKKAKINYQILAKIETGIVLRGGEIKSLRQGNANLNEAFGKIINGELWLINAHIAPYQPKTENVLDPRRTRKLLIKKSQLNRLNSKLQKGLTLVPLKIYLKNNFAKVELGVGHGLKKYQKRQKLKEKDIQRQTKRELQLD